MLYIYIYTYYLFIYMLDIYLQSIYIYVVNMYICGDYAFANCYVVHTCGIAYVVLRVEIVEVLKEDSTSNI